MTADRLTLTKFFQIVYNMAKMIGGIAYELFVCWSNHSIYNTDEYSVFSEQNHSTIKGNKRCVI